MSDATLILDGTVQRPLIQQHSGNLLELWFGRMWRNELYPIYLNPHRPIHSELAFEMERAASSLFGVVTYGVHLTMYTMEEPEWRVWVPKRSTTKQT